MANAARTVQYSEYIHEIFAHAGVAYTKLAEALGKEGLPIGAHACGEAGYALGDCPETEAILDTCVILSVKETYSQEDLQDCIKAFNKVGMWFNNQK